MLGCEAAPFASDDVGKGGVFHAYKVKGTDFEDHPFFEASSIRKVGDKYYFIYSSQKNHELCYAVSDHPDRDFRFGGTIVSNGDVGLDGRTEKDKLNMTGTTHGSIELINGQWYVFYHRLTHKSDYSRQACAEKISIEADGSIRQVEITSCGLNSGALVAKGSYPAVIACNITNGHMPHGSNKIFEDSFPNVNHDDTGRFIAEIADGTLIGYKYFKFEGKISLTLTVRGSGKGLFEITDETGKLLGTADVSPSEEWEKTSCTIDADKGDHALFLTYKGSGETALMEIGFTG